ncbi:TPA: hypothetical protein ACKRTE_003880, partial [Providencia rettgeri]
ISVVFINRTFFICLLIKHKYFKQKITHQDISNQIIPLLIELKSTLLQESIDTEYYVARAIICESMRV